MSGSKIGEAVGGLITLYVLFKVAESLILSDPTFARYATGIVGAAFIGFVAYLKK